MVAPERSFEVVTELFPGGVSAVHVHPRQDEIYEVKEGVMQVYVANAWRTVKEGERVLIPKGTIHAFRNTGRQKVIAFNSHSPGLRFGEMLEVIHQHLNEGKINGTTGFKNLAYMSSIMVEYSDVMKTIKPPAALIKWMARLGHVLGYK